MTRILCFDVEMAPASAYIWDLRVPGGYINRNQLISRKRLLCLAARFIGEEDMYFYAEWSPGGRAAMLEGIWNLLDTADAIITFNGDRADTPWVNTEFIVEGMKPPSPSKSIDLYKAVRRFNFMSSSLDYSTSLLGVRNKTDSGGMATIVAAMNGDAEAQEHLGTYCMNDVEATCELYERLKPWIPSLPNVALIDNTGAMTCTACGSGNLRPRGFIYTKTSAYRRYHCHDCGKWLRDTRSAVRTGVTEVAS